MAKYKRKAGVQRSISKYFQAIGAQGGLTVTPAKLESLARIRELRRVKRERLKPLQLAPDVLASKHDTAATSDLAKNMY